jgi:hypothetical protein
MERPFLMKQPSLFLAASARITDTVFLGMNHAHAPSFLIGPLVQGAPSESDLAGMQRSDFNSGCRSAPAAGVGRSIQPNILVTRRFSQLSDKPLVEQ